jgi:hypothetical protein
MLKIERKSDGRTTIIWLIGRIQSEHLDESDTPRGAGGLMSWAASKAVGHGSRRRAEARLC